jgi:hypothetical protein
MAKYTKTELSKKLLQVESAIDTLKKTQGSKSEQGVIQEQIKRLKAVKNNLSGLLKETTVPATVSYKGNAPDKVLKIDPSDVETIQNIKTDPNIDHASIGDKKIKEQVRKYTTQESAAVGKAVAKSLLKVLRAQGDEVVKIKLTGLTANKFNIHVEYGNDKGVDTFKFNLNPEGTAIILDLGNEPMELVDFVITQGNTVSLPTPELEDKLSDAMKKYVAEPSNDEYDQMAAQQLPDDESQINKNIAEGNFDSQNFKPYATKDPDNPNFLKVFIKYPEGVGHLAAYGQKTLSGQEREYGIKRAMEIGQAVADKLQATYNIQDIDVSDNGAGKVIVFAVSDDFINMTKTPLQESPSYQFSQEEFDKLKQAYKENGLGGLRIGLTDSGDIHVQVSSDDTFNKAWDVAYAAGLKAGEIRYAAHFGGAGLKYIAEDDHLQSDDESSMAQSQLKSIQSNASKLMDIIGDDEQLDAWVQAKLTKAEDYLDAAAGYLESEEGEQTLVTVALNEMVFKINGLGTYTGIKGDNETITGRDQGGTVRTFTRTRIEQDNPGIFDKKPREKKPREKKPQGVRPYTESQYRKILQGAIDDAGSTEFAHDIADSMILDVQILARLKKDYPGASARELKQRLQWDLEACDSPEDDYDDDYEGEVAEAALNEKKATYCGRCGHTHVKGTPCPRPFKEGVVDEKLGANAKPEAYIKDFGKSKAPQFKGKSAEKKRQMAIAAYMSNKNEALDAVGKEDDDINNDGKIDKTDKYLKHRRDVVSKKITEGVVKDFFKDPMHAANVRGWIKNPKLTDAERKDKIKAVMKDPSKFNDLMDAFTDELGNVKNAISKKELKEIMLEAYVEVLQEEEGAVLKTSTEEILGKFPTVKKTLVSLFTREYPEFVTDVRWVVPKPSTFAVDLKNGQSFNIKWMGKGFEAQIEGKKYYLDTLPQYQQALDKINDLLKNGPITTGEEPGGEEFGAPAAEPAAGGGGGGDFPGGEAGGGEETPAPEGEEGGEAAGAEFEEETPEAL